MRNNVTHVALAAVLVASLTASDANALVIASGSGDLSATDPTALGRINRNGTASTWASSKSWPGILNSTTAFRYDTVSVAFASQALQDIYYEITVTALTAIIPHPTAYRNAFDPSSISSNYLGDSGATPAVGDPKSFQVMVATGDTLVLHFGALPTTSIGSYTWSVSAFSDANRAENFLAVPIPAPGTLSLFGAALLGLLVAFSARARALRFDRRPQTLGTDQGWG
jgi:hypothetical protein